MKLTEEEIGLIKVMLEHDLHVMANKLGLVEQKQLILDEKYIVKLLNLAEKISRLSDSDEERNTCLTICGLVWEHRKQEWNNLSAFLSTILSRIGLIPSVKMVDSGYDSSSDTFHDLQSYWGRVSFAARMIESEVYVTPTKRLDLSVFQKRMWDLIENNSRVGISAPTSAGKSYVISNKIIEHLNKTPGLCFYIVPTITLINQVSTDLRRIINELSVENISVSQTFSKDLYRSDPSQSNIFVLTQERALSALFMGKDLISNVDLLVIDEIQNIERVATDDNDRSRDLYNLINDFETNFTPKKVVVAGPRITNISEVVKDLFGDTARSITNDLPPVLNLSYSFYTRSNAVFFRQYSSLLKDPISVSVTAFPVDPKKFFTKVRFNEESLSLISNVLSKLNPNEGNIIFAPTKDAANRIANSVAINQASSNELDSLINYVSSNVSPHYGLLDCLRNNTGFHHSNVPHFIRNTLEIAFKESTIKNIVCTTTLMQGVNLPAKNIIARNQNLSASKKNGLKLTPYEFANLRGRAGRLMKDFVGRAFILDENSYEEMQDVSSHTQLFEQPQKNLKSSFKERFEQNKENIKVDLREGNIPEEKNNYNDLTTHIRQTIVRYDREAIERLEKTGVKISLIDFLTVRNQMKQLRIPQEIILKNGHWDPIVLNQLFVRLEHENVDLPKTPFETNFTSRILSLLRVVQETCPYYFAKVIKNDNERYLIKCAIIAMGWAQEKSLNILMREARVSNSKDVDSFLGTLHKDVVFNFPKILQPIVIMTGEDNPILSFIEYGAYQRKTRRLIEFGLARDLAVKVGRTINLASNQTLTDSEIERILSNLISDDQIHEWERRVLRTYIN